MKLKAFLAALPALSLLCAPLAPARAATLTLAQAAEDSSKSVLAPEAGKGTAIDGVKKMMTDMGYTITENGDNWFHFKINGASYEIQLSKSERDAYISTWWNIPPAKVSKIPAVDLLTWNDTHLDYFGYSKAKDGGVIISIYARYIIKNLTPQLLREALDQLSSDAIANDELLNASKWK